MAPQVSLSLSNSSSELDSLCSSFVRLVENAYVMSMHSFSFVRATALSIQERRAIDNFLTMSVGRFRFVFLPPPARSILSRSNSAGKGVQMPRTATDKYTHTHTVVCLSMTIFFFNISLSLSLFFLLRRATCFSSSRHTHYHITRFYARFVWRRNEETRRKTHSTSIVSRT